MKIDLIKPYTKNAKKHPKKQVEQVAASIKEFGFNQPIVVDRHNTIIVGHGRYEAAKLLGMTEVPTIQLLLTEEQCAAYRLADNKLNESEWDMKLVIEELKGLSEPMLDLTGFDKDLIIEPDAQDDVIPENVPARSKLGDLYELGQHRVLCGDSTLPEAVLRLMDGKKADMVFTDPPYGMNLDTDFSQIKGSAKSIGFKGKLLGNKYHKVIGDNEDFVPELITSVLNTFDYCKEIFIWGADYFVDLLPNYGKDGCFLVWNKRSSDEQQKGIGNCFELFWSKQKHKKYVFSFEWFGFLSKDAPQEARNRVHPTMKPVGLIEKIWLWFKCPQGIVYDAFLGSGSTLIACEKTGRICYGMELDPKYVDVIVQRYVDYVESPVVKLNGKIITWPTSADQQN